MLFVGVSRTMVEAVRHQVRPRSVRLSIIDRLPQAEHRCLPPVLAPGLIGMGSFIDPVSMCAHVRFYRVA